jgi:LmbE family N-acetylglucosaminyl deacetylase
MEETNMLARAALVVAHPDDEALWFSSIADKVERLIICFLEIDGRADINEGRKTAAASFPLEHTEFFGLKESEVFNGADWLAPMTTDYGLAVSRRPHTMRGFSGERYLSNYAALRELLLSRLQGYRNVITHNPWGEYAHEEHVQVHRAVASAQRELGFDLWFTNYCSNRSYNLMLRHLTEFRSDYVTLETNHDLAARLEGFYRMHHCWTWPYDDYKWFTHECFLKANDTAPGPETVRHGHLFPLNFLRVEAPWEEPDEETPGLVSRVIRKLKAIAPFRVGSTGFRRDWHPPLPS